MHLYRFRVYSLFLFLLLSTSSFGQEVPKLRFFEAADSLHKNRLWVTAGLTATLYTGTMIAVNKLWYQEYPRSNFHLFNDMGEWEDMDKIGHTFSAYTESRWVFQGALWTGMNRRKAMWLGAGLGTLFQGSVEILDGFSDEWGFSLGDIAFNTTGCALFVGQELLWQEQRITMKYSAHYNNYPNTLLFSEDGNQSTSIKTRTDDLYGKSFAQTFLKDYNSQTIWLSANVHSFLKNKDSRFPKWLNVAVGYGAENMFGGFNNTWAIDGQIYSTKDSLYPRYRQFYLSLDIDLTKIPVRHHFLRTVVFVLNSIKIPAPTLEYNTNGQLKFHGIYF